jgi:O-antigen/teichoic acid export membrane protein
MDNNRGFRRGAVWAGASGLIAVATPLGMFLLFAANLEPVVVGRVGLALALAELVKVFGAPGLYEALLQRRDATGRDHAVAQAVLLTAGLPLVAIHLGLLFFVLGATDVLPPTHQAVLLAMLSLRIPLDLALLQPQAELARRQEYSRLARRNMTANLTAAAIGLAILAMGRPLEGLTAYSLSYSAAMFLGTVIGTKAWRRPRWDRAALAGLYREARAATAVRGAAVAGTHGDQVLLGAILGPAAFAFFNLGKRIEIALVTVANQFGQTLFQPHFARTSIGHERQRAIWRALLIVTLVCGSGAAGFAAVADLVVNLLLGPAWLIAALPAAILAIAGFGRAVAGVHASALSVTGGNARLFQALVVSLAVGLPIIGAAAWLGPVAAAVAVAIRVAATTGWLARLSLGAEAGLLHLRAVLLPFAVMLAAAAAARILVAGSSWGEPVPATTAVLGILAAGASAALVALATLIITRIPGRPSSAPAE